MRNARNKGGVWSSLLGIGLGGAFAWVLLVATEQSFTFADQAIAKSGEAPLPSVAIRLETLFRRQKLARASLGLGLMGLALGGTSYLATPRAKSIRRATITGMSKAGLVGLALGALAGAVGFASFGLRGVGDQDLALASIIHGLVWAVLGIAAGIAAGFRCSDPTEGRRAVARAGAGGLAWGVLYPPLLAWFSPWIYVEQLIPERRAVALAWSMIGVVAAGLAASRVGYPATSPPSEQVS
ncbi:hypothetical protein SAMN05444166_3124 [Singulisphaera sp. GP187]|uniref:hypothetical protein n=1 Tax=Singulisphaera sp. GP187 TaxID=1882752 RepID=UPI00092A8884|nr:hypothetical protein [Singulisphaera sp. GP187]SIO23090.1 hypothetical protein SAMN05444166_3124 [Singulisphaera sp. GP187]